MLQIEIIGPPIISRVGKIPKKAKALLIYLAVQGQPVSREKAADLLWPYQGSKQCRHSLRNCLLALRKALKPLKPLKDCLLTDSANLRLQNFVLDTDRFHNFCAAGEAATAAKLVRGELFADFEIASEPWEEWVSEQRDAWTTAARETFITLATDFSAVGDHAEAILAARRAIAFDRMHEPSSTLYMRVAAAAGRNSDALRCYDSLAKLLGLELGVSPDPDTRRLADEIRARVPLSHPTPVMRPERISPMNPELARGAEDMRFLRLRKDAVEERWRKIDRAVQAGLKPPVPPSLIRETLSVLEQDRIGMPRAAAA